MCQKLNLYYRKFKFSSLLFFGYSLYFKFSRILIINLQKELKIRGMSLVYLLFYCLSAALSQKIDINLLYNDNLLNHGISSSINSFCEISHHYFIILTEDHIVRLLYLNDNFAFTSLQAYSAYNNSISSVRCNGNNNAYLISQNSYILSKFIFL